MKLERPPTVLAIQKLRAFAYRPRLVKAMGQGGMWLERSAALVAAAGGGDEEGGLAGVVSEVGEYVNAGAVGELAAGGGGTEQLGDVGVGDADGGGGWGGDEEGA